MSGTPPPLSIILPLRPGEAGVEGLLGPIMSQAERSGAEVLIVGETGNLVVPGARLVPHHDENIFRLRMIGILESRGEIVAIGEDHAIPRPDWCEAVVRAHAERPDVPAIAGCLVNATDRTLAGRGNFAAFAAPFTPPMPTLPGLRPPPISTLSIKRAALDGVDRGLGCFEAVLVPKLFDDGQMVADDRIIVDHYQDHGAAWAVANGFHGPRAAYGYLRRDLTWRARLQSAGWSLRHWPARIFAEARRGTVGQPHRPAVRRGHLQWPHRGRLKWPHLASVFVLVDVA
ncbi:MAG: hypothetical protein ABSG64_04510 [Solirubrobacteraceae bacterium]|jgi:hypothetical protein